MHTGNNVWNRQALVLHRLFQQRPQPYGISASARGVEVGKSLKYNRLRSPRIVRPIGGWFNTAGSWLRFTSMRTVACVTQKVNRAVGAALQPGVRGALPPAWRTCRLFLKKRTFVADRCDLPPITTSQRPRRILDLARGTRHTWGLAAPVGLFSWYSERRPPAADTLWARASRMGERLRFRPAAQRTTGQGVRDAAAPENERRQSDVDGGTDGQPSHGGRPPL